MRRFSSAIIVFTLFAYFAPLIRGQVATGPVTPQTPLTEVSGTIPAVAPGQPTQTAVAITTVQSPAAPQNPVDQVMWALAMSYILKFLTNSKWFTFLTPESTTRVKTIAGFLMAAGTAAGIHLAVNGSFLTGTGLNISLTGLSLDAFKDIGFQWVSQQAWYDRVVKA